jgi:cellulose/xylan binding protein with CBM9 domain
MSGFVSAWVVVLFGLVSWFGAGPAVVVSTYAEKDVSLQLDPASPFWRASEPVYMDKDSFGKAVPRYRTEIRTRWTKDNLYFLFICPYEQLHLKPNPDTHQETNELWNWDVAEVFIGSDFTDIQRYQEFEVSPQGEWVDLDINLHKPHHEDGWTWNSGFEALARIDKQKYLWYAAMRIPFSAIDRRPPKTGNEMRINLFRSQGPPGYRYEIAWQPPMSKTFHVPERFGLLKLAGNEK